MRRSTITAAFKTDIQKVWETVTDNTNYAWRSNLGKTETAGKDKFVEYTTFTITRKEPYQRYEFDLDNNNMSGHWTGLFQETADHGTCITFTEDIRNPLVLLLSYLFLSLKKRQQAYVDDLRKTLGE